MPFFLVCMCVCVLPSTYVKCQKHYVFLFCSIFKQVKLKEVIFCLKVRLPARLALAVLTPEVNHRLLSLLLLQG